MNGRCVLLPSRLPENAEIIAIQRAVLNLQIRHMPVYELRLKTFTQNQSGREDPPFALVPVRIRSERLKPVGQVLIRLPHGTEMKR